jgi:hypothetical protein
MATPERERRLAAVAATARAELVAAQCAAAQATLQRHDRLQAAGRIAGSAAVASIAGVLMYALAMSGVMKLDDPPAPATNFKIVEISTGI